MHSWIVSYFLDYQVDVGFKRISYEIEFTQQISAGSNLAATSHFKTADHLAVKFQLLPQIQKMKIS